MSQGTPRRQRLPSLETLFPLMSRQDCFDISERRPQAMSEQRDRQFNPIEASWPPRPVGADDTQQSAQEYNLGTSGIRSSLTPWSEQGLSSDIYHSHTIPDYQNDPQIHISHESQRSSDPPAFRHLLN